MLWNGGFKNSRMSRAKTTWLYIHGHGYEASSQFVGIASLSKSDVDFKLSAISTVIVNFEHHRDFHMSRRHTMFSSWSLAPLPQQSSYIFHVAISFVKQFHYAFVILSTRGCQNCGEQESERIAFTRFKRTKTWSTHLERARCDICWQLWQCVQCKRELAKSEFSSWLDEKPSRRHTGKSKIARCNTCVQQAKDVVSKMAKHDSDFVVKRRKRDS